MDWFWSVLIFSAIAGAFYEIVQLKKENKKLKGKIEILEEEVYK